MRRFPTLGVLLAVLCMVFSVAAASAADAFPGKVFYAKGANWRAEINVAAPVDAEVTWDIEGCIVVGPSPCKGAKIAKGGALTLSSDFIAGYFAGPAIGVVNVPEGAWSASSFLEFNDGNTRTAFTVPALRWVLDNPLDDFRAATAARTADKSTCSTFYTEAEHGTAIQVVAYGADGDRARDEDGNYSPTDVYFIAPRAVAQGCLGDWRNDDGSVRVKGPSFTAGSVRLSFGCAGVGPCPAPQRTWFVVTKGPLSGATVETLPVQNIGAVEGTSAAVLAAATAAGGERAALIRLHGPAPDALREAVELHNAEIRRMRSTSDE
ncbi:MAG TPA: hypothetical protein VF761_17015 [Gemmatimonadaceae bacterium]